MGDCLTKTTITTTTIIQKARITMLALKTMDNHNSQKILDSTPLEHGIGLGLDWVKGGSLMILLASSSHPFAHERKKEIIGHTTIT